MVRDLRQVPADPGGSHGRRLELADGGGHGGEREHGPHAQGVGQRERGVRPHPLRTHLHRQVHAPPQKQVSEKSSLSRVRRGCVGITSCLYLPQSLRCAFVHFGWLGIGRTSQEAALTSTKTSDGFDSVLKRHLIVGKRNKHGPEQNVALQIGLRVLFCFLPRVPNALLG